MSTARYGKILGALMVASGVAGACGGVDQGRVEIVNEGGSDGTEPGDGGSGGSSGNGTGAAGEATHAGSGAGGESGEGPGPLLPEPPVVVSVTPADGDDRAEPTDSIRIEFSEGLDPDSVTGDSVVIYDGETPVDGELDYSGVTVEFTPEHRLDLLGEYRVVVTTDVTDADGTPLAEEFSSSFVVRDGKWTEELVIENGTGTINRKLVSPVIDAHGNALVVWAQTKAAESVASVFGRYYSPGEGFGEPFEIDTTTVACDDVSVAMNASGEAIVAWTEKRGAGEEVWARRIEDGELAGAPERVDTAATTVAVGGTLSAVSVDGEAHILWWFNDPNPNATKQNLLASHAAKDEAWLATPELIYNYVDTLSPPGVAFDDDGNGFVAFAYDPTNSDATPGRLYVRRYLASNGQWGNGVVIDGSDGVRLYEPPSVATDSGGGARVLFAADDLKVVTFKKASGFSAAKTVDNLDLPPESWPQLASSGNRFLAAWYQSVTLNTNAYSALADGGDFGEPELRSGGDFRVGYYGSAVPGLDRRGNGFVLFEQGNAVDAVDIVFGRLSARSDAWTDGAPLNSLEGQYQDPRLAVAANGVAVAAWSLGIRLSANGLYVSTFE